MSKLSGGDTLVIRAGTYAERINNTIPSGSSWSSPTTIKAESSGQVVLKPAGNEAVLNITRDGTQYIVVDGLVLDAGNAGSSGTGYRGVYIGEKDQAVPVKHVRIQNSTIRNSFDTASCIGTALGTDDISLIDSTVHTCKGVSNSRYMCADVAEHGIYWHSAHSVIEGNEFYDIAGLGMQIYDANGLSFSNVTVKNNYVHNTGCSERNLPAILLGLSVSNGLIYNNIVSNVNGVGIDPGDSGNRAYNNTIYRADKGIRVRGSVVLKNNIIASAGIPISFEGGSATQSNNLTTDPKFVNASAGNFHLQSSSPAIDKGTTLSEVKTDFEGTTRPQGSAYDIGADEYGAGSATPTPTPTSSGTPLPTPTPTPTGPIACHLYHSQAVLPAGFGSPYAVVFSPSTLLIKTLCDTSSVRVDLGSGSQNQYIYKTGHLYKPGASTWSPVNYTSQESLVSNAWYPKTANATIQTDTSQTDYILGYICTWSGAKWMCGCRDAACMQSYWQIQSFKK